ncbi:hypothetical protein JCM14469_00060 [Desulfatiferula olefinivorans]
MTKNNNKHHFNEFLLKYRLVYQLVFMVVMILFLCPRTVLADLKPLSDDQLKSSTAQAGFTNFTLSNSTARLFLDIHIDTYATIGSFSGGWYNNGSGVGWDQKWNNVSIGNSVSDSMTIDGLVFIADFDDTAAANPVLERVVFGSNRLQGALTADMSSFSGMYNDALTGGGGSPVSVSRTALNPNNGAITFNFNSNASAAGDMGLFFVLTMEGARAGLQVVAGYDETALKTISPSPNEWWDAP